MSKDIILVRRHYLKEIKDGVHAWWSDFYTIAKGESSFKGSLPMRSSLYSILSSLFLKPHSISRELTSCMLSKEEVRCVNIMFEYRKKYSLWKKCDRIYQTTGKGEAMKFLNDQVAVLTLVSKISK